MMISKLALHKEDLSGEYVSLPGKRLLAAGVHYEIVEEVPYLVVLERDDRREESFGTVYRFLGLAEDKKQADIGMIDDKGNLEEIFRERGYNPGVLQFFGDRVKTRTTANNDREHPKRGYSKDIVFSIIEDYQYANPDSIGIPRIKLTNRGIKAAELDGFIQELEDENKVVTKRRGKTYYAVHPLYVGEMSDERF